MAFADLAIRIAVRRIDISSRQKRTGYDQDSGYCTQSGKSSFTRVVPPPFFVTKEKRSGGIVEWPYMLRLGESSLNKVKIVFMHSAKMVKQGLDFW